MMEIVSNAFSLITNFICELLLFAVVDGAVKFLQYARLLLIKARCSLRVQSRFAETRFAETLTLTLNHKP